MIKAENHGTATEYEIFWTCMYNCELRRLELFRTPRRLVHVECLRVGLRLWPLDVSVDETNRHLRTVKSKTATIVRVVQESPLMDAVWL